MMSSTSAPEPVLVNPALLFVPDQVYIQQGHETTLIILNGSQPPVGLLTNLWRNSTRRICADGGANCLYDVLDASNRFQTKEFIPDVIVGDFDSIRDNVKEYYSTVDSVTFIQDQDQYSTDLTKAIKQARKLFSEEQTASQVSKSHDIILFGSLAGRVDQGLGILHELLRETKKVDSNTRIWLVTEQSVSWVLLPTTNIINGLMQSNDHGSLFTENVGILPIYGDTQITTRGFHWDVQLWDTAMGGVVSTSNHVREDKVFVLAESWVLFTIELNLETFTA